MSKVASVFRNGNFAKIWTAILISTVGNFILLLSLSVFIYEETGSNFASASVFATQWLAAIFSAPLAGVLTQKFASKRLAAFSEWIGGTVSILIGVFYGFSYAVFAFLLLRGLSESIGKTARVVALKDHVPEEHLEMAASLIGTSTFLGISLGSLIGAALVGHLGIVGIAALDCLTFALSGWLYFSLRGSPNWAGAADKMGFTQVFAAASDVLRRQPDLLRNFCYVLLTTAFFQGFHNIARTLLPVELLDLGPESVMYLQALASVSFFLGAIFVALLMQKNSRAGKAEPWLICAVTAVFMLGSVLFAKPALSLLLYALYLFLFEVGFTYCQKNMIIACPKEKVGLVSSLAVSLSTLGIVSVIYIGGWLSDRVGLVNTALILFAALAFCVLTIELRSLRLRRYELVNQSTGKS